MRNYTRVPENGEQAWQPFAPSLLINCDGLCEPRNPGGWACWAFVVHKAIDDEFIHDDRGCIGAGDGMTNNLAEYTAVLEALRWVARGTT
jgi:ribonuclease HI